MQPVVTGSVTGAVTEGNVGDAVVTATGTLSISDVDDDDSPSFSNVASTRGANNYGSFTLSSGTWTYTLDQSRVQNLDAGETVTDTYAFAATDGTTQVVTVTITGSDDAAVVTGSVTGAVTEGNVGDAVVTATGTLSISDVDGDDSPSFSNVASTRGANNYGSFTLSSGTWTYTLDQSRVQNLDAGETVTDSHSFTASDGTTQVVTVTITGSDDAAVVTGNVTGAVTEGNVGDAVVTATGTLSISDVDGDDSPSFSNVASTPGANNYGSFTLSSGTWTYTLDQSRVQNLDAGETVTDSHSFTASDGTTQVVTVTITGSDDAAVVTGNVTGTVTEGNVGDAVVTATGTLSISDVDGDDSPSFSNVASTPGANNYGSFTLSSGTWTYTLDQSRVQNLDAGETVTDTYAFAATDGTTQVVTVTITGSDDAPVVTGSVTGVVTEGNVGDAVVTATGTLSISDVDGDDSPSFSNVASTPGANNYGSFTLSSGTWTYTLDQSRVQNLDAGETVTDTYAFAATDGTTQVVTVTITGSDDAPVVTGSVTGVVTEGNVGDAVVTATGTLSISDVDDDDSPSFADVASTRGASNYGSFVLTSGTWTYTLDQATVQNLDSGETVTDTYTFTATDGTTQTATVTISGSNDAPVSDDNALIMKHGDTYSFSRDDFTFTDADTGDSLQSISVTSLPSSGSLRLNGQTVTANQVILASDIQNLVYHTPSANSDASTQFRFAVNDGQLSSAQQTFAINVQALGYEESQAAGAMSLGLNGTNQYIRISDTPALRTTGVVIETWVRLDSLGELQPLASKGSFPYEGWALRINSQNQIEFLAGERISSSQTNVYQQTGTGTLSLAKWHHIAVSYHNNNIQIYIDGAEDSSARTPYSFPTGTVYPPSDLLIGAITIFNHTDPLQSYEAFDGSIREFRLGSGRSYSAADAQASRSGSPTNQGVGFWEIDEGSGSHIADSRGSNHGQVVNTGSWQSLRSTLTGTENGEIIKGTAHETLDGRGGDDKLLGDEGDDILIGGSGNDILTGGNDGDHYIWHVGDDGTVDAPAEDIITDFQVGSGGDVLDLSDLLVDEENNDLSDHLHFDFSGSDTIVEVTPDTDGSVTQRITLQNTDLSSLGSSDSDIITGLLNNGNLQVDQ